MSFLDKIRQSELFEDRDMSLQLPLQRCDEIDKLRWDHQITQAQGRKHDLAQGAEIDYTSFIIQPLERLDGSATIAILAIIVIFENPGVRLLGPLQQGQTLSQAHNHAKGGLVGGGHYSQSCMRSVNTPDLNTEPLIANRDGHKPGTGTC